MSQMSESARRERIEAELASQEDEAQRVERLPWKGEQQDFPVVRLPLAAVILNPNSHRIKSQLASHPKRRVVEDEPQDEEAQRIIAEVLRETDKYERLKQNLEEEGQHEPGVITRDGVLVNANRRAVALRDIGAQYIDVAVLPDGASHEAISELELSLQMREDFRQEYTFTNQLIFVDELLNRGYSYDKVALMMNLAASREEKELEKGREEVQQLQRLLGTIREVQAIAKRTGGDGVPLTFFDDKRQSLLEIDDAYQGLKDKNEDKADLVKRTRMVGLLTDAGYSPLREIDADFLSEYLLSALDHVADKDGFEGDLRPLLTSRSEDGGDDEDLGLDVLGPDEESSDSETADPERLLELLASSHDDEDVEVPRRDDEGQVRVPREEMVDHLTTALELAADEHKSERRLGNRLEAPHKKIDEVRRDIDILMKKFGRVHDHPDFDWDRFEKKYAKLRRSYEALLGEVVKQRPEGRDGTLEAGSVTVDG